LQSTNEELETSKEELQSVNEELVTLNAELQAKIDELSQTENDMKILLDSTNIGIIFLDGNLCINRFTSEATKLFSLIPTDVGRSINDIRSNLYYDHLGEDAQEVTETLQTKDLEVRAKDGQLYVMRITPYRTLENVIDGAVVTLTNITELKRVTTELDLALTARKYAGGIVETVREPLVVLDEGLRILSANRAFYRTFQVTKKEVEQKYIYEIGKGQWNIPAFRELLEEVLPTSGFFEDFTVEYDFPRVGKKKMLLNARRIVEDKESGKPLILLAIEDVTDKKS
jgi:two-component system CheB/CheR fusion protein